MRKLSFGDGRGRVFGDCDASGEKYVTEVVETVSEELELAELQRYTGVLQQRQDFVDVLQVVFELALEDQHVVEIEEASLEANPG